MSATRERYLIKGGGGALTREKIVAAASRGFVCIVDDSKLVDRLGRFPAAHRSHPDGARLRRPQRSPAARCGAGTSSPTTAIIILDVHDLASTDPVALERDLNQIARCGHGGPIRHPVPPTFF